MSATEQSSVSVVEDADATAASPPEEVPEAKSAGTDGEQQAEEAKGADGEEKKEEVDDLVLYPLPVRGPAGEQVEVQVSPSDTVMDLKQFLADMPETCFYTCYDLILTKPDGVRYHLVDFVELGEVADVSQGGCLVEMFNMFYDERSVRMHVRRTRELCSVAGSYSSASTLMAMDYEGAKALATERDLNGELGAEEAKEGVDEGKGKEEGEGKEGEKEKGGEKEKKGGKGKGKGKEKDKKENEEAKVQREKKDAEKREKERLEKKRALIAEKLEGGVGFAEDLKGALAAVASGEGSEQVPTQCFESIAFSSFNPAPGFRRLQGDLCYLDLVTAEGRLYCVTAHTRGFYVNRSGNGRRFDPRPTDPKAEASTLVGLLRQLSPKFPVSFKEVMEHKANRHPFENMPAPLPPVEWVARPVQAQEYTRQVARAEDALMAPFGTDVSGTNRDWNEELQSCRELPRTTLQDRILRDRAVYRVSCEFADAAVKGAKAVVSRSLPPINPHDPDRFHMFVYNNIFFSWASDTDFTALQQIREAQLKAEAEKKAAEEGKGEERKGGEGKGEEGKWEEGKGEEGKDKEGKAEGGEDKGGKTEGGGKEEKPEGKNTEEEEKKNEGGESKEGEAGEGKDEKSGAKEQDEKAEGSETETAEGGKKSDEATTEAQTKSVETEKGEDKAKEGDKKEGEEKEGDKKEGEEKEGEDKPAPFGEAEQASYASSNNDLKGTIAMNKADIEGLYTLGLAVIDYRGHRVIAQSIIPGILYGDRSTQMLYGSVDNGKTIKWSDKFHTKAQELAAVLGLKEHKVKDGEGNIVSLCSPVETKGILGSDDRKYLLDLVRLFPRDANVSSPEPNSPANRLSTLRPELTQRFLEEEAVKQYMVEKGVEKRPSAAEIAELKGKGELPKVSFNVNALTEFPIEADQKEVEEDEGRVRGAGKYLMEVAIPETVEALKKADERPLDGAELTETLHRHGINMRYLGKVAAGLKEVPHLWKLCVSEMAVRATKRVLKAVLRETIDQDVGGGTAHFLNCFLGTSTGTPPEILAQAEKAKPAEEGAGSKKKKKGKGGEKGEKEEGEKGEKVEKGEKGEKVEKGDKGGKGDSKGAKGKGEGAVEGEAKNEEAKDGDGQKGEASFYIEGPPGFARITGDMVWSDITEGVKYKYKCELPPDARELVRSVATLRNICLKMGVTLAARDYELNSEAPIAVADVQDLSPLVKTALPQCADATKYMEEGARLMKEVGLPLVPKFSVSTVTLEQWLRTNEAKLNSAFEALSEAYQILQQVSGPLHTQVATCCRYLGTIFFHAGETGNAVLHQHRELIICERILGADHPHTIHCYGNLGLYFQTMSEPQLGLRLCRRALQLMSYVCGPHHPEIIPLFVNCSLPYQELGLVEMSHKYLEEALKANDAILGPDNIQAAVCYHALALSHCHAGSFKAALQQERKALAVYEKAAGKEDERSKESEQWVQTFLERELKTQKHKQSLAAAASTVQSLQSQQQQAAALRVAEVLKQRPDLLAAIQSASPNSGAASNLSYQRAVAELLIRSGAAPPMAAAAAGAAKNQGAAGGSAGGKSSGSSSSSGSSGGGGTAGGARYGAGGAGINAAMRARGMDERAQRAAAEARRKAAARGVNLRGAGAAAGAAAGAGVGGSGKRAAPVDVEELINYINAAARVSPPVASAVTSSSTSEKASGSTSITSSPAPAGLGAGLGVGLGAVPLATPPASKASGKKAGGLPNGDVGGEHGPMGLGGGLGPLPSAKGKGKSKKEKPGDVNS